MQFVEQPLRIQNVNFDFSGGKLPPKNGELMGDSVRMLVIGPSGCGKSNLFMTLIRALFGLRFFFLHVYTKTAFQDKYELLRLIFKKLHEIELCIFSKDHEIPPPEKAKRHTLMVFDDVQLQNQRVIQMYLSLGRHKCVDIVYQIQSYANVKKHNLRDNCNCLVIFRQDELNLKHIFDDHVMGDMSFKQFKQLCEKCWSLKTHGFAAVMKDFPLNHGRYRCGFSTFVRFNEKTCKKRKFTNDAARKKNKESTENKK